MRYIADLHVHSHYSRATSKDLNLESLYRWAKVKGINVVGTGDFTHPGWFAELKEKLRPDGNGFFTLKNPPKEPAIPGIETKDIDVRFCLTTEISSIYKHGDRVRKNHNLVYAPDLDTVARLNHKLSAIGNLEADGRPILGLPSRDLLEIVLETSDRAYLIPAHIWTPWFSTLGSKAGYDSIDNCFRDLTDHLFAVETGLSSDPAMNWKLSTLDRFTLISNSDAHSPAKLGREANLLNTELSYDAMFDAFKTGEGFMGTYEFYPQEGKYHHDGHRKCNISLEPQESLKYDNTCPECGEPLTVGVLHRVEALADRDNSKQPDDAAGFKYIIPLPEVLGEIEGVGPNTKTVRKKFRHVISTFGNEFSLMHKVPIDDIRKSGGPVLAESIRRIRENDVHPKAGYDGVYGVINVFEPGEIDRIRGQLGFFSTEIEKDEKAEAAEPEIVFTEQKQTQEPEGAKLNRKQQEVADSTKGATLVKAGPGTGKTFTLIEWLTSQVESGVADASEILAVTFTTKAADELKSRLQQRIGAKTDYLTVGTFHALCWRWLRERFNHLTDVYDASSRKMTLRILFPDLNITDQNTLSEQLEQFLELGQPAENHLTEHVQKYRNHLWQQGIVDISDLIHRTVEELNADTDWLRMLRQRYKTIAIDELQDINPIQYELVKLLGKNRNLLAIGDADQAIYGFRGADVSLFFDFPDEFNAREIALDQNYRSTDIILKAATSLIQHNKHHSGVELHANHKYRAPIKLFEAANPFKEADYILDEIENYIGGTQSLTTGAHTDSQYSYGYGDIAVLFRSNAVGEALFKSFLKSGIPVQFGDGSAFLSEPPFTMVAHMLRLTRKPDDQVVLSDLLEEAYGWSRAQISSLLQTLNKTQTPLFGPEQLVSVDDSLKQDLIDLRKIYQDITDSVESGKISDAVKIICDHFIGDDLLNEPQKLKKETLVEIAEESNGNVGQFLEQMQLNPYTDAGRLTKQAVRLLTFHAAKGLEFPVVFIVAAEEGISPVLRKETDIEEERRLFYVAMTRARDELQITYTTERVRYGEKEPMDVSRFVNEIPAGLIEVKSAGEGKSPDKQKAGSEQLKLF